MDLKKYFIKATEEMHTFEKSIPAYYFRRALVSEKAVKVKIRIAVCGFYELYFNGNNITRGFLSPYVSNTNHYIYYDEYNVTLDEGENIFGVWLGNGFQNNPSGHVWDFDKADFRSVPMFAMEVTQGEQVLLFSDDNFKIAPSPILGDDYRFGEYYDANCEIDGWNLKGFDDSNWQNALPAIPPKGELRIADVAPIIKYQEIAPVEITKTDDGYIYDFGISNAGICRLRINGHAGQKVIIRHADSLKDGDLNIAQIVNPVPGVERDIKIAHMDTYVCKGVGTEEYQPRFTYHGFRYAKVTGITEQQATKELLTYLTYHTQMNTMGDFSCSDPMANYIQEITRRSMESNLHHIPTDCPQREKNGWTADAALVSETVLLNYDPERNYREWMRNICKAQREDGALPGIVPTGGWGFHWGNGPAWDSVLSWLPYYTYIYRGQTEMITESAPYFVKYLNYLRGRCDENGLLSIGLGDWCHIGGKKPMAPLIVTDTINALNIAAQMALLLDAVNMDEESRYASEEAAKYRDSIREHLVDRESMTVHGDCQTSQSMALYYGVFDESEEKAAFDKLLELIRENDDHMNLGVLGGRVIFHVLTKFGYSDLAYKMIVREDYPSYGNWVKRGATTLWENFNPTSVSSMNHEFWGDVSAWFIKRVAGIQLNPNLHNVNELLIKPSFISDLDNAKAYHIAPAGKISVSWKRDGEGIILELDIPDGISAQAELEDGFRFESGECAMPVASGVYKIVKK